MSVTATPVVPTPKYWTLAYLKDFYSALSVYLSFPERFYSISLKLNFQVTIFWEKVLDKDAKERLVSNIAGHLKDAKDFIQKRAVSINHW